MTVPADDAARGRGGPPVWFALFGIGGLVLAVVLIGAQALGIGAGPAAPPPTVAPAGEVAQRTRDLVAATLAGASFQVIDPQTPYRPGESPSLVTVPRRVIQAVIPAEPNGGNVVIYELPTSDDADRVGRDFARYLASGTGAVQYPRDARFVLRRVGTTLVFFPWSPLASPDPRVAQLADVLATIGEPVPAG
jgi:hypothetical protein